MVIMMFNKEGTMRKQLVIELLLMMVCVSLVFIISGGKEAIAQDKAAKTEAIKLPAPRYTSDTPVEKALLERRTVRTYKAEPLTVSEVSQILWAAQGITDSKRGLRTAPSPRAMYLVEVYLIAGDVTDLPAGMYKYRPQGHELLKVVYGDVKDGLYKAAGQAPINKAPAALLIAGKSEGSGNPQWAYLEAGHVAENVFLQAVSLGLGTISMAGFKADEVKKALNLPANEQPIYIMPLGRK